MKKILSSKAVNYALMILVVCIWGLEYIVAKNSLDTIEPLTLVCLKYAVAFTATLILKLLTDRTFKIKKRDILFLVACALFGDVLYYGSEYGAMSYIPVSVITIILAFVPALSILLERLLYKRSPTVLMVIGILVGVVGVAMVVCSDLGELAGGKIIGYLLAFGAVICWNAFNFLTDKLTGDYKPLDIVLCQLLAAMLISAPYGLTHLPAAEHITADLIGSLLYLGIVGSCIGFVLYVNALAYIGVTPSALFTNLLPVITTLFAWLFLGEAISPLQLAGGLIVILSGCAVIWLKSRHELSLSGNTADEKHGD